MNKSLIVILALLAGTSLSFAQESNAGKLQAANDAANTSNRAATTEAGAGGAAAAATSADPTKKAPEDPCGADTSGISMPGLHLRELKCELQQEIEDNIQNQMVITSLKSQLRMNKADLKQAQDSLAAAPKADTKVEEKK